MKLILSKEEFVKKEVYGEKTLFDIRKVIFINRPGKYVLFHCKDAIFEYRGTLTEVENILMDRFCRVHNEYIINVDYVLCVNSKSINLNNGLTIPVARRRQKFFENYIKKLNL